MKQLFPLLGLALLAHSPSFSQAVMDVNEVSTVIKPGNGQFWDFQQFSTYEVPKGSGKHSLFLGTLWVLGKSSSGSIDGMVERYRTNGVDWASGPLKIDGTASTTAPVVFEYGRVWKIDQVEIDALRNAQSTGALAAGTYTPPADIAQWPGNGPAGYASQLAPFHDANGDGIYNINQGDYPVIKGERMLYWIFNDNFGLHNESQAQPMGIEIHASFYACKNTAPTGDQDLINYTTFLEYEIINRGSQGYHDVYAGFNTDADIGYAMDDYTGCHVDANAFYFYNGDAIDAQGTESGPGQYGANAPVQSIQFLEGVGTGRPMSSYMYYNNSFGVTGDPEVGMAGHYYNLLGSRFKDGTPVMFGGNGYPGAPGVTTIPAQYMFPGPSDPTHVGTGGADPGFEWTQENPCPTCTQQPANDQRGVGATGPFDLAPGQSVKVVLGLLTTFDSTLSPLDLVEKNRQQNKLLKQWYANGQLPCIMPEFHLSTEDVEGADALKLFPNPANVELNITGTGIVAGSGYVVSDINGRELFSGKSQQEGLVRVPTEGLSSGIYFVRLTDQKGRIHVLKFVKR